MERQDWAWSKIKAAIMKSLLVTGISNVFGTWEDGLIRSDTMMEGIDAQLLEVFGERSNQPPPADDIMTFLETPAPMIISLLLTSSTQKINKIVWILLLANRV